MVTNDEKEKKKTYLVLVEFLQLVRWHCCLSQCSLLSFLPIQRSSGRCPMPSACSTTWRRSTFPGPPPESRSGPQTSPPVSPLLTSLSCICCSIQLSQRRSLSTLRSKGSCWAPPFFTVSRCFDGKSWSEKYKRSAEVQHFVKKKKKKKYHFSSNCKKRRKKPVLNCCGVIFRSGKPYTQSIRWGGRGGGLERKRESYSHHKEPVGFISSPSPPLPSPLPPPPSALPPPPETQCLWLLLVQAIWLWWKDMKKNLLCTYIFVLLGLLPRFSFFKLKIATTKTG